MIYVTVVPTLRSALSLLAPIIVQYVDVPNIAPNRVLLYVFSPLILLAGIAGSVLGLLPILRFHQVMLMHKTEMTEVLNRVSSRIVALKMDLAGMSQRVERESTGDIHKLPDASKPVDDVVKEISALESFYKAHQNINTWPLNRQVLIKIWATQTFLWGQVIALWNSASKSIQ